jgi:hypothetical protein
MPPAEHTTLMLKGNRPDFSIQQAMMAGSLRDRMTTSPMSITVHSLEVAKVNARQLLHTLVKSSGAELGLIWDNAAGGDIGMTQCLKMIPSISGGSRWIGVGIGVELINPLPLFPVSPRGS